MQLRKTPMSAPGNEQVRSVIDLESAIREWDGESVLVTFDQPTGAWIFIALHSTRLGPAGGGTRMKVYPNAVDALRDALRLAAAMTNKFAVPGLPYGGGKAVISIPADFDASLRPGLLKRYGQIVNRLGGLYLTGPDVGTSDTDMDVVAETGASFVFGKSAAAGGRGNSGAVTAAGVFAGIEGVSESVFANRNLKGRTVLVQGIGNVGGSLIHRLSLAGANVLFNDVDAGAIEKIFREVPATFVSTEDVYDTPCDIFAPCALGGTLNERTIPRLRCRAVAGAANNQLADPQDALRLQHRGILYAPDYVVNVGGAMGLLGTETLGWSQQRAEDEVAASVHKALREVFALAKTMGSTTAAAAEELARRNIASAKPWTRAVAAGAHAVEVQPNA